MKILLTGATGFLGSHILKDLIKQNDETIVLKRSFSNDYRINQYRNQYKAYDIDKISLAEIFQTEAKIDAVIHCATTYGRKSEKISEIFQANTTFPLQLIEVATQFNTNIFINSDTFFNKSDSAKSYMQNYVVSKNQFLEWGKIFAETEKINFINMKLEHIYGEDDSDNKFCTFVIRSLINNIPSIDLSDGNHLRDFIYIDDVVSAYLAVLKSEMPQKGYYGYEVGYGFAVRVKEFVNTVKNITNSHTNLNYGAIPYKENEILYSQANITKLLEIGWSPKYDIEKGLNMCINKSLHKLNN